MTAKPKRKRGLVRMIVTAAAAIGVWIFRNQQMEKNDRGATPPA